MKPRSRNTRGPRGVRRIGILVLVLSSLLLHSGEATIRSTELRDWANYYYDPSSQVLFWSSLECAIDAALHAFGPIDDLLRFPPPPSEYDDATFASTATSSSKDLPLLWQDARQVWEDFVHIWTHTGSSTTTPETKNSPTNHGNTCHELTAGGHHHHSVCSDNQDETQPHNHSSLQIRGGGAAADTSTSTATTTTASPSNNNNNTFRLGKPKQEPPSLQEEKELKFSLFQDGDGSQDDPDGIPKRFLDMHGGDRQKAQQSLAHTLEWRAAQDIDTTLVRPHPKFAVCKEIFPTSFLGRNPDGHVIFLQRPALMDVALAQRNQIDQHDVLEHYIYMNEYLWQIVEGENPLGTMVSVLDLTGLDLKVLRNRDYMNFLKLFISVMDAHYPQRAHKTLVVNSPKWVGTLYRLVKPFLREETTKRIEIYSRGNKQDAALQRVLGPDRAALLPASFWSPPSKRKKRKHSNDDAVLEKDGDEDKNPNENQTKENDDNDDKEDTPLHNSNESKQFPESELDAKLLAHTNSRIEAAGQKMQDVALC